MLGFFDYPSCEDEYKTSISDCQAPVFGVSSRWWSPCLVSDLSPRSCGAPACWGCLCAPRRACALVAGLRAACCMQRAPHRDGAASITKINLKLEETTQN